MTDDQNFTIATVQWKAIKITSRKAYFGMWNSVSCRCQVAAVRDVRIGLDQTRRNARQRHLKPNSPSVDSKTRHRPDYSTTTEEM
jgi:hypothetical protein